MRKEHSCNALKVLKIIRIILSIILLSYTLSLCIIGHCADEQDYFPMEQNKNGKIPENIINYLDNNFTETYYTFCYFEKREVNDFQPGHYYYYYRVVLYPLESGDNIYGEISNDLIHFSLYALNNSGVLFRRLSYYDSSPNNITVANNGSFAQFQNLVSSNYDNTKDYVSNFQVYTNNNSSTRKIVLLYGSQESTINDGDVASEDMERPEIQNYIPDWTNTPTFDNSSVENALESVYNGVVWLGSNIKDTITGTGEYISDTMRWSIQKILNTIRDVKDGIESKINEVKTSVLTVVDKIEYTFDYISQSYDSTKVNTAFNSMAIKTDYNNMTTVVNNAFSVFDSTSEPMTFKIPVHLENIPILHINTVQYIDLGWLYDSRLIIRAFMWCVTTFSLLYTIIDALPSYLQGNDE